MQSSQWPIWLSYCGVWFLLFQFYFEQINHLYGQSSPDMVELELSSLVSRYSDVTADHIRALLTLRGDISSAEGIFLLMPLPWPIKTSTLTINCFFQRKTLSNLRCKIAKRGRTPLNFVCLVKWPFKRASSAVNFLTFALSFLLYFTPLLPSLLHIFKSRWSFGVAQRHVALFVVVVVSVVVIIITTTTRPGKVAAGAGTRCSSRSRRLTLNTASRTFRHWGGRFCIQA